MAISYTANFDYNTQQLVLTDTRDYAGEGLASGVGIFKVTDPLGNVIYKNTGYDSDSFVSGDVIYGTSTTHAVALPLVSGAIVEGVYTVSMKNQVSSPVVETELTQTYNFANPTATVNIDVTVNINTPSILAEDSTVYGSGASVVRAWTVFYPASLALTSITGTAGSILLQAPTDIYTGSYEAQLVSTVTYTVASDATLGTAAHTMAVVFTTVKKFVVDSSTLCAAYDCVKAMEAHYQTLLSSNTNTAADFKPRLDEAIRLLALILTGISCGQDTSTLYADLKEVYDNCSCDGDCACDPTSNDVPTLITPTSSDLIIYDVAPGTGIDVTPVVVGNTKTWTISLSPSTVFTVALNNGTPDELTITDTSSGNNFAWTISHKAPDPWVEVDSFLDADYVKITTESYLGNDFSPLKYRMERKYTRSDAQSSALVRLSGQIRLNRTSGAFLADDVFDIPGTTGTRYRPQFVETVQASLFTGTGTVPLGIIIRPDGRVNIEDPTDLSSLTAYSGTYFIVSVEATYEAIEPVP